MNIDTSLYNDAKARTLEGRSLSPAEIGCALSHRYVYQRIVSEKLEAALVLEDDAILHPDVPFVLQILEANKTTQNFVIKLDRCDHSTPGSGIAIYKKYKLIKPILIKLGSISLATGYVLGYKSASAMANLNFPVSFPADNWGYYTPFICFRGITPSLTLVTQNSSLPSSIITGHRVIKPYKITDLLLHGFKTYTCLGRISVQLAKKILKKKQ